MRQSLSQTLRPQSLRQQAPGRRQRLGFTLIELLVVIAIIGILVGLLIAAVQKTREAASRMSCQNNLKQIGLALHSYHDEYGRLPAGYEYLSDPAGNARGFGWAARILPHLEQTNLYRQFNFEAPIWDSTNEVPRMQLLNAFICPSDPKAEGDYVLMGAEKYAVGNYVANFGPGDMDADADDRRGVFSRNSKTRFADIIDGLSNTFFAGERINGPFRENTKHGVHVTYETTWAGAVREITDPTDDHPHMVLFQTGHLPNAIDSDDRDISTPHSSGGQFLLGDGSVHFLNESISYGVYQSLGTRAGSEQISIADAFQ